MIFKKHECDKCGKKFHKVEELMHHQLIAHENRLYVCEKCGMGFEGMEQMRDHAKKFHSYNKQVDERKRSDGL
jgi:predicted nucleic acid-binding Zn ribbon protein